MQDQNPQAIRDTMRDLAVPDVVTGLTEQIDSLRESIESRAQDEQELAIERLAGEIESRQLREGGKILRDLWKLADSRVQEIRQAGRFVPAVEAEEIAAIEAKRDADLQKQRDRLLGLADLLEQRHPPQRAPRLTPEVAARASMVANQFGAMLPEDLLASALEEVATASDPSRPEGERTDARAALKYAYLPLLRRRAAYPEKFAVPFADAYRDALELVEGVLADGPASSGAREMKSRFKAAWEGVDQIVRQNRGWDDTLTGIVGDFFDW